MLDSLQDIEDDPALQLNGAFGLSIVTIGADTYLYASGYNDDGVSGFRIGSDGRLTNIVNIPATAESDLGGPTESIIVTVGSSHFLVICGIVDDGRRVERRSPYTSGGGIRSR